jgi:phage baseplate assembly protein W
MLAKFLGCPYPIQDSPLGYLHTQSDVNQIKSDLLILLLTNPGERCLTADTKIPLANGTESTIKDLVGKPPFWVYSFDKDLNAIVPGMATAYKTLENAELMEITLDNQEKVRCTPDHLWLLRNGEYCRADNLCIGDSLMPLYRHLNTSKYERIYQPYLHDYRDSIFTRTIMSLVAIRKLDVKEDCYDLKVEKYHNFALSAGVFVHNCMLPTFGTPLKTLFFEPNDIIVVNQAREMIVNAISTWEPRVAISDITVSTGTTNLNSKDFSTPNSPTGVGMVGETYPYSQNDDDHCLSIQIKFFDPENIQSVQELVLEVPLS